MGFNSGFSGGGSGGTVDLTSVNNNITAVSQSNDSLTTEVRATTVTAVAASEMNLADGKRYFTKTASGPLTWSFASVPAAGAVAVVLELTSGSAGTQTWPPGTKWPGGTAPTLSNGVDMISFVTDDGGSFWRSVVLMTDSK